MTRGSSAKTVIIIGAGASGLEAANVLLTHQRYLEGLLNVVVLEARDRIGGRISIHRHWDEPFDTGIGAFVRKNLIHFRRQLHSRNFSKPFGAAG
jgi:monoamine oxidase